MENYTKVEDVQKLFEQLLPYEKRDFLVKNMWNEKLVDTIINEMMRRYDKDEILNRYYSISDLEIYLKTNS